VELPARLVDEWRDEEGWLNELPHLVSECAEQWNLTLERPFDTPHSLVVPAGEVVLKLNAPSHFEADHEADALARWDGRGAVRLLARDDDRRAFVCERCRPGLPLSTADADGGAVVCELVSSLAQVLDGPHPYRTLAAESERWSEEVPAQYELAGRPFEQSLLDAALDVYRTVDTSAHALVNQDLHADNILRAQRLPWLVIDPKPVAGERELNGVGLLRNADSRASVRRWLDALAELGLDRERLRGWGVAHALAWGWDERHGFADWSVESARQVLAA
jgi:streptomycin 6-kinase